MDAGPAVLAVVLQAGDVGTEEGGELAPTACPLALVAHLVVQDIRLDLHLAKKKKKKSKQNRILGYHIQKTQIEVAYAQIHKKFTSCSSKQSLKQRAQ